MSAHRDLRPDPADRPLVVALARIALAEAAPDELPLLDDVAAEFFAEPDVLDKRQHEEMLGFGIETGLLAPYVLAIATPVVSYLLSIVADAAKTEARPLIERWVRQVFRTHRRERPHGSQAGATDPSAAVVTEPDGLTLTADQARRIRQISLEHAESLGLGPQQARLLADAMVGSVLITGD